MAVKIPDAAQVITVDLDMLRVEDRWNARNVGDREAYQSEIKRLAKSIKDHGQDTPVIVRKDRDGKYFLLAGFRRYHAIKEVLGNKTIRVAIRESTGPLDDLITNLRENVERKNLSTYDLAVRCHLLRKEYKMAYPDIASALSGGFEGEGKRLSAGYLERLIGYVSKLHPSILAAWRDGERWATVNAITQSGIAGMKPDEQKDWADKKKGSKGKGKDKGKDKGKKGSQAGQVRSKRVSPAMLEAALKACQDSRAGESYVEGVIVTLTFALGRRLRGKSYPMIPKVYDPRAKPAKAPAKAPEAVPLAPASDKT